MLLHCLKRQLRWSEKGGISESRLPASQGCSLFRIYTWHSAFRAAAVLGCYGAGGLGWFLKQTIEELENLKSAAIFCLTSPW